MAVRGTVTIETMSLEALVELVNGWGSAPRAEDGRADHAYPPITETGGGFGVLARVRGTLTGQALADAADRLHPVFAATDAAKRARLISDLLAETAVRPTLSVVAGHPRSTWLVPERRHAVLASGVVALRSYLADQGNDRLGVCTGRRCADVYIDASPGGRRRFCSVTCQNRARVAAFRARRAQAT